MPKARMVTYKGETHSLSEWARIYNISPQALNKRLRNGMTFDEAISKPTEVKGSIPYQGKYITYKELARLNGTITENGARSRIEAGWSPEKVIQVPSRLKTGVASVSVVKVKGKKREKKVEKPTPKEPDITQCKSCQYRGGHGNRVYCDFAELAGHCRIFVSKPSPNCTVYVKGKPLLPVKTKEMFRTRVI